MLTDGFNRFFKSDEEKIAEAEEIISFLKDSPALEALRRERDDKRIAKQRELLSRLETLQREKATTMPQLEAAVVEAKEAEKLANDALLAAARKVSDAEHARLSKSLDLSFAIGVVEAEINRSAPTEIDAFISELTTADEKARGELKIEQRLGPKGRITGEHTEMIFESNKDSVTAARDYIRNGIAEAQSLKLQTHPLDEIVRRLTAIKDGIPKFDRFQTTKVPLPDIRELRRDQ
jgi:hypothetical protein